MENDIRQLSEWVWGAGRVVFFGGAGVSTESGIPDFRGASGLYAGGGAGPYPPEEILHTRFFYQNTDIFYRYYFSNLVHPSARPNAAHTALAGLESAGKLTAVITQNIDGLHQAAGSKTVVELHGSVHRNYCTACGAEYPLGYVTAKSPSVPLCGVCGGVIKPDVVLYGEPLRDGAVQAAVEYMADADILIIGGTSLSVYPAAGLIRYYNGARLVLINRSATPYDRECALVIRASVGDVLTAVYQPGGGA